MLSLNLIAAFVSAARHESFANAARELGITPSAVAKNISSLEAELGVRLFHRTTRRVNLSPDGDEFYSRCRQILEDVEALEASAVKNRSNVRGTLSIDVPITYGRQVVLPLLLRLQSHHPNLKVDARFSDRISDIVKDGVDAAVRVGPLEDSTLIGRTFDEQVIWTCASDSYLKERGRPETPGDLAQHNCLTFRLPRSGRDRPWQFNDGRSAFSLTPRSNIRLGDGEALVCASEAGMGIIQVPSYMVETAVARGTLVEILQEHRPAPTQIMLVYPSRRHVPPRLRALMELLDEI
ncbi:MAG: LysR family transcriptional regulator [Rhodospirillaceae bacterium]|nr:LysR family transcriptional regulator [Rhodospirillaceae bacterium]MBT6136432.1 LysR family transcriptional regulator [Rhodospirillaceae bacterium]